MGPPQFWFSIFPGIHRNPKQKEFFNSCEGFLIAALTGYSHPSPFWKIAKMALFKQEIWKNFGPNAFIWSAMKAPFSDFIQNLSQAPSKCLSNWIKVDKWDYFKNPSQELKIYFCLGFLWIPRKTERQNWRGPIF